MFNSHDHVTIVGVDESGNAQDALMWYLNNIHRPEFRLILVHCAEPYTPLDAITGRVPTVETYELLMDTCRTQAKDLDDKYRVLLKEKQIDGEIIGVFSAQPGQAIVEIADREKAKMIVTGTRGMGRLRRTLMGSVSDYVVHHAHCPVLVCRH